MIELEIENPQDKPVRKRKRTVNREASNARHRERYLRIKGTEVHKRIQAVKREWWKKNAEKKKKYNSDWNRKNPDKRNQATKRWAINNPLKERIRKQKKKLIKLNADGAYLPEDIIALFNKQKGLCVNCKKDLRKTKYDIDHIMPLSKGGSNWPSNLQLLCPSCNRKKWNKDPIQWAQENGRLF